jgi:integrase
MSAYLEKYAPTVPSAAWIADMATNILVWWGGGKKLSDVTGENCRAYREWRTAQRVAKFTKNTHDARFVSEGTARHELSVLSAVIRWYHREYHLPGSVPVVTLPPKPAPRENYFLTREDFHRRVEAAARDPKTQHLARVLLIGWYSGTRPGAILKLRWMPSTTGGHVDLDADPPVIYRRPFGARRTNKRQPPCRIHRDLVPYLKRWRREDAALGIIHVVHYQGSPVLKVRRSWVTVRKAAGAQKKDAPHVLRHSAATWMMQSGDVPIAEISGFLGMSVDVLMSTYAHHHPDYQDNAANAGPMKQRNRKGT